MEEDRSEAIKKIVARLGMGIFKESLKVGGGDEYSFVKNVVCIVTTIFDGVASSLEKSTNGIITFDDMVDILKRSHAITSSTSDDEIGSIDELIKGLNLN